MPRLPDAALARDLIHLHKNETLPHIYDVDLQGIERLRGYDGLECHIVLYPYSRAVNSAGLTFFPFEEYVQDVLAQQRSAYALMARSWPKLFGLLIGLVIALFFLRFKPDDLFSVESVVSIFGAYVLGKELWDDIENGLIELSKGWRLRYREDYYRYKLEKHTTLALYSSFAKRQRYGKAALTPERMDVIKQSNSETVRMCFDLRELRRFEGVAHLLSIHVEPALLEEFERGGFLLGVKLSLNRRTLGVTRCWELFQSQQRGACGCLDEAGGWMENTVFYRRTVVWGRLKYFREAGVLQNWRIIMSGSR